MNNMGKYIYQLVLLSVVAFAIQYFAQQLFGVDSLWEQIDISLLQIYFVQAVISLVLIIALNMARKPLPNFLGFVFLGVFTIKVAASYFFARPVLEQPDVDFFKYNFLLVFFMYMIFDLYVAYSLLNKGEETPSKKFN